MLQARWGRLLSCLGRNRSSIPQQERSHEGRNFDRGGDENRLGLNGRFVMGLETLTKLSTGAQVNKADAVKEAQALVGRTALEVLNENKATLISHNQRGTGWVDSYDINGDGKPDIDRVYNSGNGGCLRAPSHDSFHRVRGPGFSAWSSDSFVRSGTAEICHVEIEEQGKGVTVVPTK